jgi:radical SAM protein with 4Fe4S-binding SPASM domain
MHERRLLPTMQYGEFSRQAYNRSVTQGRIIKAQLELTYRCNLHCRHCYTDPYNAASLFPRELTLNEIHRLLDEMRDLGIIWLNLSGGDIFMHPDFFEIYERAHRQGFLPQLYTNGTLFTRAVIERLQAMPPFTIDVSCHSVKEERFDWFTQVPGSYRAFRRGMTLLQESGLPFTLKTKLMDWNKDEIDDLRAFTESFGQSFGYTTSLSPRLNGDCSSLAYRIDPQDLRRLEQTDLATDDNDLCAGKQEIARPDSDRLYRCGCGTNSIHISAWGELGACTLQYEHRVSLRTHSLRNAVAQVFGAIQSMRYQSDSPCRSCDIHRFCEKKPTDARWEQGVPEAPIPYDCDIALVRAEHAVRQPLIHPLRNQAVTPASIP